MVVLPYIILAWLLFTSAPLVGHPTIPAKPGYGLDHGIQFDTRFLHAGLHIARWAGSVGTTDLTMEVFNMLETLVVDDSEIIALLTDHVLDLVHIIDCAMSAIDQAPTLWKVILGLLFVAVVLRVGALMISSLLRPSLCSVRDAPSSMNPTSSEPSYRVPTINITYNDDVTVSLHPSQDPSLNGDSLIVSGTFYSSQSITDLHDSLLSGSCSLFDCSFSSGSTYLTDDSIFHVSPSSSQTTGSGLMSSSSTLQVCHYLAELSADLPAEEFAQGGAVRAIQKTVEHNGCCQSREVIWTWIRYSDLKWVRNGPLGSRSAITPRDAPLRPELDEIEDYDQAVLD